MTDFSEQAIEQDALAVFAALGYATADCWGETFGPSGSLGRQSPSEVLLPRRLRAALERLNPNLPSTALDEAMAELARDRASLSPTHANREIYTLLKSGVKVRVRDEMGGGELVETAQLIDWRQPERNDFFAASQFKIAGDLHHCRADIVGFVNGIPLLFVELKASHVQLENAYRRDLRGYRETIPQVFWYNAFIVLSNASQSRMGSITASWSHFNEWKRVEREDEQGVVSLETMIRGTCAPARLLDIAENFTLFSEAAGGLLKLVARNHQYLGVNRAIAAVDARKERQGRLGVFWHTQGSGKSYSMVFFTQKILRTRPGGWTFLVVTDRTELDDQIYKTFAAAGVVTEGQREVQARSAAELQRMLSEQHRLLFSLIQKFRTEKGGRYPKLSERDDIIVIADEAHRSQYDTFATNMRAALPNAGFIGFTGTPLISAEERTRQEFGDYVSIYDFKQSVEDHSTVPLYYENRIPELQLTNSRLDSDMADLIEEADLSEEAGERLQREFAREYHLITRDERLEKIAEDIVAHFMGRGQPGKAMIIAIDKATAVRMYDKVRKHWAARLEALREGRRASTGPTQARDALDARIRFMEETDMAVVVSEAQHEVQQFRDKGLEIAQHRKRMNGEDLETKFKDPRDPLRIVFVCAMWITGFDVPALSTIYLDKPMRNHTLMQTIARANRVFEGKTNGLIVDYVGVFGDMQRALAIYGSGASGALTPGETPVQDKRQLVAKLREMLAGLRSFCTGRGIDLDAIGSARGFALVRLLDDAVEALLTRPPDAGAQESRADTYRVEFLALYNAAKGLLRAIMPDPTAQEFAAVLAIVDAVAGRLRGRTAGDSQEELDAVLVKVEGLLDHSVATDGYLIAGPSVLGEGEHILNLSSIDIAALQRRFTQDRKHTEAERLKGALKGSLERMVRRNGTRMEFMRRYQELIDDYNKGATSIDEFIARLLAFTAALSEEEQRTVAEGLSEEELAVFDLLTRPHIELTGEGRARIKRGARDLLAVLKREKLVLDWRKRQQARAQVRTTITDELDRSLPEVYNADLFNQKVDAIYQHIYDSYYGQGHSLYGPAA